MLLNPRGHAVAPPSSETNSRRLMGFFPEPGIHVGAYGVYRQALCTAARWASVRGSMLLKESPAWLQRYYEPLRHPRARGLSLTGFRLVIANHASRSQYVGQRPRT